jgi:prephenate dehydrogenase
MWRDVLLANRDEVLAQSRLFQQSLTRLEATIRSGDAQALEDLLTLASETRAHWRMGAQRKKTP